MESCCICHGPLGVPVYESPAPVSITTMFEMHEGHTRVWHCDRCGHTQTAPLPNLAQFYAEEYNILTASEEEDQLYAQIEGRKIYRTEHQVDTLLSKVKLPDPARILDYGCAKASTLKALCARRPNVRPHVFDVGEQYQPFWNAFVPESNQAINTLPDHWAGHMDGVISFFALEHVAAPREFMTHVRDQLRDGGWVYFLVPNMFANTADLVVADHVNHFSESSLRWLLAETGFVVRDIDATAHNSAWVVLAEKSSEPNEEKPDGPTVHAEVQAMAEYWSGFGDRVRAVESATTGAMAIYGSGFYGTFIYSCLAQPERVEWFLDQNPHRQGQELMGKPIVAPEALPANVSTLFTGLNPRIAREELAKVQCLQSRELKVFYP